MLTIQWTDVLLLALLVATALVIVRMTNLWAAVMLMGIYSFLSASWMLILDSPDVAFTEASVGAGISTILALAALSLTTTKMKKPRHQALPLAVVLATGALLIYGTLDMPHFADPKAPIQLYPSPSYVDRTWEETEVPNVVTAVLASYRGYDTLGETTVIFTAGTGVMLLLRNLKRRKREEAS